MRFLAPILCPHGLISVSEVVPRPAVAYQRKPGLCIKGQMRTSYYIQFSPLTEGIESSGMVEREVGNRDGMEEGKENAHRTLLEIMYAEASRLPRSRCMSLA